VTEQAHDRATTVADHELGDALDDLHVRETDGLLAMRRKVK